MRRGQGSAPVVLLLGKPVKPGSIVADVLAALAHAGLDVSVHLPNDVSPSSDAAATLAALADARLVVHRGLSPDLLGEIHERAAVGPRWCNPLPAAVKVHDRLWVDDNLSRAGLPTPTGRFAATWSEAVHIAAGPSVVKSVSGWRGRGASVLLNPEGDLPAEPPFAGPYLVQAFVAGDGLVRKLYTAGDAVFQLLKDGAGRPSRSAVDGRSPTAGAVARAVEPSPRSRKLALAVGEALGLEIYGVDVLVGPDGPRVIDVNPFPGFRGIVGASDAVAAQVLRLARHTPSR